MTLILAIQLEFTHAIGPTPGLYVVQADSVGAAGEAPASYLTEIFGPMRPAASADIFSINVIGASPARRGLAELVGRRRTSDTEPDESRPVSILHTTFAFASKPFSDDALATAAFEQLRSDPDRAVAMVEHTLRVVNRAIAAFRVAAEDPYVTEVAPEDPRAVRVLLATPDEVRKGEYTDAFALSGPRRRRVSRAVRASALRPSEAVAHALAHDQVPDPVELHLLRAHLDLEHRRPESARAELGCALQMARTRGNAQVAELHALDAGLQALCDVPSPPSQSADDATWDLLCEIRTAHARWSSPTGAA